MATSFYGPKDEEIATKLVKQLLETDQPIPDFLEQYKPEDGLLDWGDDETDNEGEENLNGVVMKGKNGAIEESSGWDAAPKAAAPSGDAWGSDKTNGDSFASGAAPTPANNAWAENGGTSGSERKW
jgi:ATP-dependent RNA helicase DDX3X